MKDRCEVAIVGGGIAGASLAYFLAQRGMTDVVLLEREAQPGHHATGRSAAVLAELDPIWTLHELKVLGAEFLRRPPAGFAETPLLTPSGIMALFREPAWSAIRQAAAAIDASGTRVELLSPADALARVPALRADRFDGAVLLPDDGHLDVHAILWGYLGHARRHGVEYRFGAEVESVRVAGGRVTGVVTRAGELAARWVVNAAGAWAGRIGALAAATPIALVPHRRTIVVFDTTLDVHDWPMVASDDDRLYFAPESGGLKLSPMDEDAMEPCDARPDDVVIAAAFERLARLAPALVPRTIRRKWSGLRTFAPDRVPVVGEDPRVRGFFWLAGQGGCGIETSPALGAIAADLLLDGRTVRFDVAVLSPARFAAA
ncbi:MAG TPA: FAD-dependent oxidoreductase [Gaiellaceae bacterium]|nr:FAD-dependent oxidoreductase [Gaiellaceae bacterium]